jgi:hypothetical protein
VRISGLGFLVVALLLLTAPIVNYFKPDLYLLWIIPAIAFIFCSGLFFFNYRLYKQTNAGTPWKNSLVVMAIIIFAMVLSAVSLYL